MKTGKRRLTAFAVVAATMLLALVGVVAPAWAEDSAAQPHLPVKDNKVTITSTLTMNENAVVPNATFNYSIAPADEESELTSTSGMPVYAGVTDAVTLSPTSVNFSNKGLMEHPAVGAWPLPGPFTVAEGLETILPHLPEVIPVDIYLMIVGTDRRAARD